MDAAAEQSGFMQTVTAGSTVVVVTAIVAFHVGMATIALMPRILPASPRWYLLGSITYPLYLLHNRVGKSVNHLFGDSVSPGVSLVAMLVVAYGLSSMVAAVTGTANVQRHSRSLVMRSLSRFRRKIRSRHLSAATAFAASIAYKNSALVNRLGDQRSGGEHSWKNVSGRILLGDASRQWVRQVKASTNLSDRRTDRRFL